MLVAALAALGGCAVDAAPQYLPLFSECSDTSECGPAPAACFPIAWESGSGLMCSQYCSPEQPCPDADSVCYEQVGDPVGWSICYARCMGDVDCHPSFTCAPVERNGQVIDRICMPRSG
jgi:hypothetical protein